VGKATDHKCDKKKVGIIRGGYLMNETKDQEKTCKTCKHLRIKDYVIGICLRTYEIKQPCNSCGEWEKQEERDFYAC
jgi:hypothetical protein